MCTTATAATKELNEDRNLKLNEVQKIKDTILSSSKNKKKPGINCKKGKNKLPSPRREYRDHAQEVEEDFADFDNKNNHQRKDFLNPTTKPPSSPPEQRSRRIGPRGGVTDPFPLKLHRMLEQVEADGQSSIVSWRPHGRAFAVHLPKEFTQYVMPRHFRQTKLTSFQRQLNLYGFSRLTKGVDAGAYYHELFLRGRPFLCRRMIRTKVKGTGHKSPHDPRSDPDFYKMTPVMARVVSTTATTPAGTKTDPSSQKFVVESKTEHSKMKEEEDGNLSKNFPSLVQSIDKKNGLSMNVCSTLQHTMSQHQQVHEMTLPYPPEVFRPSEEIPPEDTPNGVSKVPSDPCTIPRTATTECKNKYQTFDEINRITIKPNHKEQQQEEIQNFPQLLHSSSSYEFDNNNSFNTIDTNNTNATTTISTPISTPSSGPAPVTPTSTLSSFEEITCNDDNDIFNNSSLLTLSSSPPDEPLCWYDNHMSSCGGGGVSNITAPITTMFHDDPSVMATIASNSVFDEYVDIGSLLEGSSSDM